MAGYRDDMHAVFSAADAFALTSREDPFPTVVLEALSVGLPVVAFDRSGGIPDMLRDTRQGVVVPYGDLTAMAAAVTTELNAGITDRQRAERHALITDRFSFRTYVRRLMELAIRGLPSVSVVVPNYNYARHMPLRLGSIFAQSHPVHEIIVLDDASTDDSATVIPMVADQWDREIRFVPNETNSGSVFAQWRKAAELATGEFVWLAEADDAAEPDFLTRTLALLGSDPDHSVCLHRLAHHRRRRRGAVGQLQTILQHRGSRRADANRSVRGKGLRAAVPVGEEPDPERQRRGVAARCAAAGAGGVRGRPEDVPHGRRLAAVSGGVGPARCQGRL